jgi:hypothetical protein
MQTEMNPSYVEMLKAFVEGEKDLREWPSWWQENASLIEENEGRIRYLKIKHEWQEGARQILDDYDISYQLNESITWDRCKSCGEPLFNVVPGETSQEEINTFAQNSNLADKGQIAREGWIHPGTYCPNGCTEVLVEHFRNAE